MRIHRITQLPEPAHGLAGLLARQQVLALQLGAVAGREVQPEMRQSLIPAAPLPRLRRGPLHRTFHQSDVMPQRRDAGQLLWRLPHGLQPGVAEPLPRPAGEEADAVGRAHQLLHTVLHRLPGQPVVDILAHLEGGHRVQAQPDHDAECAQVHHGRTEVGVAATQRAQASVGEDQLHGADRTGQRRQRVAGAVGSCGHRSGHGDVRQRSHVRQGSPLLLEPARQLAVAHAGVHGDGGAVLGELKATRQRAELHQVSGGVGDGVETVPTAHDFEPLGLLHLALQLLHALRAQQPRG